MASWRRRASSVLGRLGVDSTRVGSRAVLLARGGPELAVEAVDDGTWVVRQASGSRTLRQVGQPDTGTHLLIDTDAARANMQQHQASLGNYLAGEHIAWMLRELDINCVLDVGANVGQFGRRLRRAGYKGRIVSYEPLREFVKKLRDAASQDAHWHVVEHALGDADAEMEINARPGAMSSLLPVSEFGRRWSPRLRQGRKETISVRRLDGLFDSAVAGIEQPRVYLKLDTQGYDLQAFAGAGERIGEVLGMQSEVSCVPIYDGMHRLPEQIMVYEDAGFEITGMYPVSRDGKSLRVIEFDVMMVRPEAVAASTS